MITKYDIQQAAENAMKPTGDAYLDGLFDLVSSATYYRFLYRLAMAAKPEFIVELGSEYGRSTAHLAACGARVLAVDSCPKKEVMDVIARYNNVQLRITDSTERDVLDNVKDGSVDICFFDSDHYCYQVMKEYGVWFQKMKPGGVMLFDDITMDGTMIQAWWLLEKMSPHLERIELPQLHHSGFGAIIIP